jgi:DNA-binding NarL/FixJ family response regulator
MKRASVLLADDHTIVAEGLRRLLETEFKLVGVVSDGPSLLEAARKLDPDVIVADITMPGLSGIEVAQQLKEAGSRAKVIILTMHQDVKYAMRAFEVGASGFVLKHSAPSELITAIRESLEGRTYLTPQIAQDLLLHKQGGAESEVVPVARLTPQQQKVLHLLAQGHSLKEVAHALHISPRTAEFHKYRIMKLLKLESTAELVRYAIKEGVITD